MLEIPNKATGNSYTAVEFTDGIKTELQDAVANTGITLSQANQTQLMQALTRISGSSGFYTDTGTPNVYQLVLASGFNGSQLTAYNSGLVVEFLANGVNTGAATASVSGLTATNIEDGFGNSLTGGEIQPNSITKLVFQDAPNRWIFVRPSATPRVQARLDTVGNVMGKSIGVASSGSPGTGQFDITFTTPFANVNYFALVTAYVGSDPSATAVVDFSISTASFIRVLTFETAVPQLANSSGGISVVIWENN